nr:MAG TPA: hypothetical protein [Caudoviricetes sp.]
MILVYCCYFVQFHSCTSSFSVRSIGLLAVDIFSVLSIINVKDFIDSRFYLGRLYLACHYLIQIRCVEISFRKKLLDFLNEPFLCLIELNKTYLDFHAVL